MSKKVALRKSRKFDLEKACEELRQECNKHTPEERRRNIDAALRIIYSSDAEAPARRR